MTFHDRYGPWAVITGASQGIGRAFAHQIAAQGVNCVLVARREYPLATLATELHSQHGIECLVATVDLTAHDGVDQVLALAASRAIGLFIHNAGADTVGHRFLDTEVDRWMDLTNLTVSATIRFCHDFGAKMKARRRGGIILVGSGAYYGGSAFTAVYSGAKAFELSFGEGLWSDLRGYDVDVLYCELGPTDTPAFRDLLQRKGTPVPPDLADPVDVAWQVLDGTAQ